MKYNNKFLAASIFMVSCFIHADDVSINQDTTKKTDVEVEVDFLYWGASQEGNAYALSGALNQVGDSSGPKPKGELYEPGVSASSSFKIGLGKYLDHDDWKLAAKYTYFTTHSDSKARASSSLNPLEPIFIYSPVNSIMQKVIYEDEAFVDEAKADWKLLLNNIDLTLEKDFFPTTWLSFSPFIGLQGAFIEQKLNVDYSVVDIQNIDYELGENQIKFKQNYWGLGPVIGLNTLWSFVDHIGLYFDASLSALWGQFSSKVRSYDTYYGRYLKTLIANQSYNPHTISPVVDIAIGLQFILNQDNKNNHFRFLAGWEQQIWWDQAQHSASIPSNNLFLEGLTVKFIGSF